MEQHTTPDTTALGDQAERIVRRLGEELSSLAESLPDQIAGALERVRADVTSVDVEARRMIERHPLTAVAVALAGGYLLARMVRRS
jgi:ElaB/YqjD/DUF883 family membrane-anchored ribosome-binding protein